jgi:hypothetical protein
MTQKEYYSTADREAIVRWLKEVNIIELLRNWFKVKRRSK